MTVKNCQEENGRESFPFVNLNESERHCCCNCTKLYDSDNGTLKQTEVQWFDHTENVSKKIGIVEAVVVAFEGLLNMNENRISPLENISLCYDCLFHLSELYCHYRMFMGRSVPNAYFRRVFQKCMLWPYRRRRRLIAETVNEGCPQSSEIIPNDHGTSDDINCDTLSPKIEIVKTTTEIEVDELILNDDCDIKFEAIPLKQELDYCEYDEPTDTCSECLPNDDNTACSSENEVINSDKNEENNLELSNEEINGLKIATVENLNVEAMQLPNGKWFLPKTVKVRLKKYVDGDRKTLDIGKHRKLCGQKIILSSGQEMIIPYQQLSKRKRQLFFRKQCSICPKIFRDSKLYKTHRREHRKNNERKITLVCCQYCGKTMKNKKKLKNHELTVHGTEKPFECSTCGKRFAISERLRTHMRLFHENTIEYRRQRARVKKCLKNKYVPYKELHPEDLEKVTCEICNKVFSSIQAKIYHDLGIHKNEKPYGCKFCEKRFIKESQCTAHEQIHLGIRDQRVYTCESCGKSYTYNKALQEHIATHHSNNETPFMCEICGRGFHVAIRLRKHKERVHETLLKTHECDECHRKFKTKHILTVHKKLHSEERPFLCPECGKTFKKKDHWKKHTVTQHCMDSVANCDICRRGFMTMSAYEEHVKKGYHIQPKWLRQPTRKRNYNCPSYVRVRMERKLERQQKRRERELLNFSGDVEAVAEIERNDSTIVIQKAPETETKIVTQEQSIKTVIEQEITNQRKGKRKRNSLKKPPVQEKIEIEMVEHSEQIIYDDMQTVPEQIVLLL